MNIISKFKIGKIEDNLHKNNAFQYINASSNFTSLQQVGGHYYYFHYSDGETEAWRSPTWLRAISGVIRGSIEAQHSPYSWSHLLGFCLHFRDLLSYFFVCIQALCP